MSYYILKITITTALVIAISEVARRSSLLGAILASVPLVSVLAMIWLYVETRDVAQVAALSKSIVWLVLPSLVLFIVLPALLARGVNFYLSLSAAAAATIACYFAAVTLVARLASTN